MAGKAIKPVLYYVGESIGRRGNNIPVPVADQWVVYLFNRISVFSGKAELRGGLARTNHKGIMYSCISDLKFDGKKFYASRVVSPWIMKKYYSYKYLPVSFAVNQEVCLFIWPYKYVTTRTTTAKYLNSFDLAKRGYVKSSTKAIFLPCPEGIYVERIKKYGQTLKKKNTAYEKRMSKAVTCAGLLDQAYNLVVGRGRHIQISLALQAGKEGHYKTRGLIMSSDNIEGTAINVAAVNKLKNTLAKYVKGETRRYKRRTFMDVQVLSAIFLSGVHSYQYSHTNWTKERGTAAGTPPKQVIAAYDLAYEVLVKTGSRTAGKLYIAHFGKVVKKAAAGKSQAKQVLKEMDKKAAWIKNSMSIMSIVANARTYRVAGNLRKLSADFKGACRFLEARGVITDFGKLEAELNRSLVTGTPVNVDGYFEKTPTPVPSNIKASVKAGISAISMLSAFQKESRNNRDTIEKAGSVYGFATDVMDIPAIQSRIPKGAVISKGAGTVGAVADWGVSIYDMYNAAGTGDGKKFGYSVVSYAGKGFVAGGTILLLTPFAPLGALLIGFGAAVSLIGSICKGIIEFKTVEEKKFLLMIDKKLAEHDPSKGKWVSNSYKYLIKSSKVKGHYVVKEMKKQNPGNDKLIDDVIGNKTWEEYIHKFFSTTYWGFQYEKLQ